MMYEILWPKRREIFSTQVDNIVNNIHTWIEIHSLQRLNIVIQLKSEMFQH